MSERDRESDDSLDHRERIFGWQVPGSKYAPKSHVVPTPQPNQFGGYTSEAAPDEIKRILHEERRPFLKPGVYLVTDHGIFQIDKTPGS